jgi:hypothetical protein
MTRPAPGTAPGTAHAGHVGTEFADAANEGSEHVGGVGDALEGAGLYVLHHAESERPEESEHSETPELPEGPRQPERSEEGNGGEHTAHALGAAGSGVSAITSAVGGAAGLLGFVQNVRRFHLLRQRGELTWLDGIELGLDTAGNAVKAGAGLGDTLTSAGRMGAEVGAATTASSASEAAIQAFGGIDGGIGVVSHGAQTLISGSDLVLGVIQNIRHHRRHEDTDWTSLAVNSVATLDHFLGAARSAISSVNGFLKVAGHAGDLANVVPLAGASVNIVVQMLEIAKSAVEFVTSLRRLLQAVIDSREMNRLTDEAKVYRDVRLLRRIAAANTKRWKRQIPRIIKPVFNALAALVSIAGSVMNICGTATAPAYGAGGALIIGGLALNATAGLAKLGTSLLEPAAMLQRWQKQLGRNVRAGEEHGKLASLYDATRLTRLYDPSKSSEHKQRAYLADIAHLFERIDELLPYDADSPAIVASYEWVQRVIEATGVDTHALYAEGDEAQVVRLLLDALKKRD